MSQENITFEWLMYKLAWNDWSQKYSLILWFGTDSFQTILQKHIKNQSANEILHILQNNTNHPFQYKRLSK